MNSSPASSPSPNAAHQRQANAARNRLYTLDRALGVAKELILRRRQEGMTSNIVIVDRDATAVVLKDHGRRTRVLEQILHAR